MIHSLFINFDFLFFPAIRKPAIRNYLDLPPLESQQPTPPQMQSFNLFGAAKSISEVDSPKECERSGSVLSHRVKELEDKAKYRGESQE
jgi:YidC/Oxa1 family membrane protein insertase